MAITVSWKVGGREDEHLKHFAMAFERAGDAVANLGKHVYPRMVPVFETALAQQFDSEGSGPAGHWVQLSAAYARWKEQHYPGRPILVMTGRLREALTNSRAPNALRSVSTDALEFGTRRIPYATVHQYGYERIPPRPFLDFDTDTEAALQGAALEGVRAAVKAASDGLLDFEGDVFDGQQVFTGARGGRFVMDGGRRTYLKRNAAGAVVRRSYGRRR